MGLKGGKERCKLHNYNLNKWKKQKRKETKTKQEDWNNLFFNISWVLFYKHVIKC